MEFFGKVFTWFASISSKLPVIDFRAYYIIVLVTILVAGLCVAISYIGSRAIKLKNACNKITNYLFKVDSIDDENLADFINQCITSKIPSSLRDRWLEYLNVRFGFPSDIVSEKNVYDREVKNLKELRPRIFLIVGLLLLAIFAFWGFGTLNSIDMSVIHFFGLVEIAIIYLLLLLFNKKVNIDTYEAFYKMQEELDVKVDLQVERNYATDSSPLSDLAAMVDEIIARNTAKIVDITEEMNSKDDENKKEAVEQHETPIETLIAIETAIEEKENAEKEIKETIVPKEEILPLDEVAEEKVEDVKHSIFEDVKEEEKPIEQIDDSIIEEKIQETPIIVDNVQEIEQENKPLEIKEQTSSDEYKPSVSEQKIWRKAGERIKREKKQPVENKEENVDPMSMYQDLIPVIDTENQEDVEARNGLRIGKKVGLGSLNVEDVLMGSDFSEVEGEEEDEEEEKPKNEKKKASNKKKNKK